MVKKHWLHRVLLSIGILILAPILLEGFISQPVRAAGSGYGHLVAASGGYEQTKDSELPLKCASPYDGVWKGTFEGSGTRNITRPSNGVRVIGPWNWEPLPPIIEASNPYNLSFTVSMTLSCGIEGPYGPYLTVANVSSSLPFFGCLTPCAPVKETSAKISDVGKYRRLEVVIRLPNGLSIPMGGQLSADGTTWETNVYNIKNIVDDKGTNPVCGVIPKNKSCNLEVKTSKARLVLVERRQLPDLTLTRAAGQASASPGSWAAVNYTVGNIGHVPTEGGQIPVGVYLSKREYGTELGRLSRDEVKALLPGETVKAATTFQLPTGLALGAYWVSVFVNPGYEITEGDENNNIRSVPLTVRQPLVLEGYDISPRTVNPGDLVTFTYRLRNPGEPLRGITLGAIIDPGERESGCLQGLMACRAIPAGPRAGSTAYNSYWELIGILPSGESSWLGTLPSGESTWKVGVSVPETAKAGSYAVEWNVSGTYDGPLETVQRKDRYLVVGIPRLRVSGVHVGPDIKVTGDDILVTYQVRNDGSATVAEGTVAKIVVLRRLPGQENSMVLETEDTLPAIAPKHSVTWGPRAVTLPASLPTGTYLVAVALPPDSSPDEDLSYLFGSSITPSDKIGVSAPFTISADPTERPSAALIAAIAAEPRLQESYTELISEGWGLQRTNIFFGNSSVDADKKVLYIDDDDEPVAIQLEWTRDVVRKAYQEFIDVRLRVIRDKAIAIFSIAGITDLERMARVYEWAVWFWQYPSSNGNAGELLNDMMLVFTEFEPNGLLTNDGTFNIFRHGRVPNAESVGFKYQYRDNSNQVRHATASMQASYTLDLLGLGFMQIREASESADHRLNDKGYEIAINLKAGIWGANNIGTILRQELGDPGQNGPWAGPADGDPNPP